MTVIKVDGKKHTIEIAGDKHEIRRMDLLKEAALAVRAAVTIASRVSGIPYEIAEDLVMATYKLLNESIEKEITFDVSAFRKDK